jgi:hypothetical protein
MNSRTQRTSSNVRRGLLRGVGHQTVLLALLLLAACTPIQPVAPGATDGATQPTSEVLLAWEGYTEMGDGDPSQCKSVQLLAGDQAMIGPCSEPGAIQPLPPHLAQEFADLTARFAPFTLETDGDTLLFQGAGDIAGEAAQRAVLAWTHFTYSELVTGRTSAAVRSALSWFLGELPDQPGICAHVNVLVYGYAYADEVPCQGGDVQTSIGDWLTAEELADFDAFLYQYAPFYQENNYLSGLGTSELGETEAAELAAWVETLYTRLTSGTVTVPSNARACASGFTEVRAATEATISATVAAFEPPQPGELMLMGWDPAAWEAIVAQVVTAGEQFLNECADATTPLADQAAQLATASQTIPPMQITIPGEGDFFPLDMTLTPTYPPTTQLLDIDQDGSEEIILHTQVAYFDGEQILFGLRGGVSVAYFATDEGWQGQVIWPIPHYVAQDDTTLTFAPFFEDDFAQQANWSAAEALIYDPGPQVQMLDLADPEATYMALTHVLRTPVNDIRELTVLRWQDRQPTVALRISLNDWCATASWEIRADGSIFIPELPEPFPHCTGSFAARTFTLEDGQFVMTEE